LIYNPAEASRRIVAWKKALPWIQPHYAIKSCPSMDLIKDLAAQGAGMDCASRVEIEVAMKAGVSLDHIVYSNPIKIEKDIMWAVSEYCGESQSNKKQLINFQPPSQENSEMI